MTNYFINLLLLLFLLFPNTSYTQSAFFSEILEIETNQNLIIFNDFVKIEESKFFLINNRSQNYIIKTFNQNENTIENRFARHGRGPGEINLLGGFTLDEEKKHIFLTDYSDLKIKKYSLDGEVIHEQAIPMLNVISLTHSDSTIIATNVLRFSSKESGEKEVLSLLIDDQSLEVKKSLYFNIEELKLRDEIEDYQKLESIDLYPKTIQVESDLYIVVFENINKMFLINSDSEIIDQINLPIPNYRMIEVTYNPQFGYGHRPSNVLYDFVKLNDRILFTFGDRSLSIPFGVAAVRLEDGKLSLSLSILSDPDHLNQEEFLVTSYNNAIWAFDGEKFVDIQFTQIE